MPGLAQNCRQSRSTLAEPTSGQSSRGYSQRRQWRPEFKCAGTSQFAVTDELPFAVLPSKSRGRARRAPFRLLELENESFSFGIGRSRNGPYGDRTRVNRRLARPDDFDALVDRWAIVKRQRAARADGIDRHWAAEPVEDDL